MEIKKMDEKLTSTFASRLLTSIRISTLTLFCSAVLFSCSSDSGNTNTGENQQETGSANQAPAAGEVAADDGKGVGPIKSVEIGEGIDGALADQGKAIFEAKCTACHQLSDQKVVGPGLAGVTERRTPEWIMNMIINPEEMTKQDPVAKKLFAEHLIQMVNQDVNEQDVRAILEYLRQNDQKS